MADLGSLADAVESAVGASRELDIAIALSQPLVFFNAGPRYEGQPDRIGKLIDGEQHIPGQAHDMLVPAYTTSLDAALTLADAPELMIFGGSSGMLREAMSRLAQRFDLHMSFWPEDQSYAEWLARFVTAAALRARSAREGVE